MTDGPHVPLGDFKSCMQQKRKRGLFPFLDEMKTIHGHNYTVKKPSLCRTLSIQL